MGGAPGDVRVRDIAYSPLPSQKRFHESAARFKGFSGPIGSGKSQALCHEAIRLTYLNPGRLGLIGAPTYPMLRDATLASFSDILHVNRIPYEYSKAENLLTMRDTGSRVLFRSLDEFERLRGTNLAWFGIDELTYTAEEAWLRLEGRLRDPSAGRLSGFAVWTPKGYDWVFQRFIKEPVPGYEAIIATPFENRHLLDKVPDFYERLKRSYDEQFFGQEVLGEYLSMNVGLVYHAFDRKVNVREVGLNPLAPLLWALDFNVDPMSSVIAEKSEEGIGVIDEIVLRGATTEDACEEFQSRYPSHVAGVVIFGDASGSARRTTGMSDYTIVKDFLRRQGYRNALFRIPVSNPSVRERVTLMNAQLAAADGEARLFVHPKCRELIQDFEEVTFKKESSVIDKDRDSKRTHLSDALGYLVWQECRKQPPFGEQRYRLL
ncbi:MAG: terminase family protein [Bryobacteraceae bacterium]